MLGVYIYINIEIHRVESIEYVCETEDVRTTTTTLTHTNKWDVTYM